MEDLTIPFTYQNRIRDSMSTTSVFSIRIDSRVRKMIDGLDNPGMAG
ncbi:hypothetical protein [Methanoculleus sp.]|nr:hypothetical protein [Methanoculleus sp.]MCK9317110.1 hypothetical protein [Methanoculleus sp.]